MFFKIERLWAGTMQSGTNLSAEVGRGFTNAGNQHPEGLKHQRILSEE
jgi:hypothetical protein